MTSARDRWSPTALFRRREGAAAVEFAILAPITLALVFSIIEAGWIMTQSTMLDRASSVVSRILQIEGGKLSYSDLKKRLCLEAVILSDCEKAIRLEFTPITTSADFPKTATSCVDRSVPTDPVTSYKPGQPSQIVFVRACYVVHPLIPGLGFAMMMPTDKSGYVRLTSRFAFVNEPI